TERFKFFNNIYQLYLRDGIGSMYSWQRPTWSIVLSQAQDIAQAQLWRKYAITMGQLPFENYWPGYPPLEE
ncbi:hypothetical protein, partial [Gilliamella sp. Pra-s52]|uniref:hypothetical protein n=1 Tax=Gilliamella sp. Pra-s52 TaxID=2687313 RepID=UPI001F22EA5B